MEKLVCSSCFKPKATLQCGPCESPLCKNCASFLDDDRFAYQTEVEPAVQHGVFCHSCFAKHVIPAETRYDENIERAKNVLIYYKNEHKETRFVRRMEEPVSVPSCIDREETILRLAFMAVQKGFNAVLDVDLVSKKVREGSYQTTVWKAAGIPAHVEKMPRPSRN